MLKNIFIVFTLSLLTTSQAYAQSNVWTNPQLIKAVQVMNNGGFLLTLETKETRICSTNEGDVILFYPNQNNATISGTKSILSTALMAFTTEMKVKIMYSFSINSEYCRGSALYLSK